MAVIYLKLKVISFSKGHIIFLCLNLFYVAGPRANRALWIVMIGESPVID